MPPDTVLITLTTAQAKELSGLLWECCCDRDSDIRYVREDLPLTAIWRTVADAYLRAQGYTGDAADAQDDAEDVP